MHIASSLHLNHCFPNRICQNRLSPLGVSNLKICHLAVSSAQSAGKASPISRTNKRLPCYNYRLVSLQSIDSGSFNLIVCKFLFDYQFRRRRLPSPQFCSNESFQADAGRQGLGRAWWMHKNDKLPFFNIVSSSFWRERAQSSSSEFLGVGSNIIKSTHRSFAGTT